MPRGRVSSGMAKQIRLAGVFEASQILGISKSALADRRRHGNPRVAYQQQPEFPVPIAELRCGPIWDAAELYRYKRRWELHDFWRSPDKYM
jgi:hypothetical protein